MISHILHDYTHFVIWQELELLLYPCTLGNEHHFKEKQEYLTHSTVFEKALLGIANIFNELHTSPQLKNFPARTECAV